MINLITAYLKNWNNNRVKNHILYWSLNLVIYLLFALLYGNPLFDSLITKLFYFVPQIVATYILVYFLVPKLLLQKKYISFFFTFLIVSYTLSVFSRILVIHGLERVIPMGEEIDSWYDIFTNMSAIFRQYLVFLYITPMFFILAKYSKDNYLTRLRLLKLEKEKTITELKFLKSQVHPHFLFNTLNNIYVLALKKKNEATEIVKKLADLMEYMFNHAEQKFIPISEEITLLSNYIDLEKIRYGDRLVLSFDYKVEDVNTLVAPLILLSFVENAFKHGASGNILNPEIGIGLIIQSGILDFKIHNTKMNNKQIDEQGYKRGIGIKNVKRQLDLIYPDKYKLEINDNELDFIVSLCIRLN